MQSLYVVVGKYQLQYTNLRLVHAHFCFYLSLNIPHIKYSMLPHQTAQ